MPIADHTAYTPCTIAAFLGRGYSGANIWTSGSIPSSFKLAPPSFAYPQYNIIAPGLRKMIKLAAIRCHIFKLKYTKYDFGWTPLG